MRDYTEEEQKMLAGMLPNIALQLRSVMSNLYMAMDSLVPPEKREQDPAVDRRAAVFCQSYYQLYRVVNNLTEAGRLFEHDRFTLYDGDIVGLCRSVCREVEFLFELRGVALEFSADRESRIIGMDGDALRKLMMNLLSNALKFTPAGGRVRVRVKTDGASVKIIVSDTGRGMSADRLDHLFDRFLQTDRYDPVPHGLGLGLAICRRVAQGHGGTIVAQSEEGKGSVFTVSLPAIRAGRLCLHYSGSD